MVGNNRRFSYRTHERILELDLRKQSGHVSLAHHGVFAFPGTAVRLPIAGDNLEFIGQKMLRRTPAREGETTNTWRIGFCDKDWKRTLRCAAPPGACTAASLHRCCHVLSLFTYVCWAPMAATTFGALKGVQKREFLLLR